MASSSRRHVRVRKGRRSTDWQDYPPEKAAFFMRTPSWCRHRSAELGPAVAAVVGGLLGEQALHRLRSAQGIIGWPNATATSASRPPARWPSPSGIPPTAPWTASSTAGREQLASEPELTPSKLPPTCTDPIPCLPTWRSRQSWKPISWKENSRACKLSGMLATLEARLAQARAGELGHLEFLEVLLEDEIARREAKALSERIRRARFEDELTLEDFDFSYNPKLPAPLIRDLAALRFMERGESVLLFGPVGVGKTHVAQALGHLACRRGYSVLFAKTSRVLAELAGGRADGSWEQRLRRLARFDLLILDDFALRAFAASARGMTSTSCSPSGPATARSSSPPTAPPRTGMSSSPTRWWPRACSIGSSTPPSTCTWRAKATGRSGGPDRGTTLSKEVRKG